MFIIFLIFVGAVNAKFECSQNAIPVFTINDYTFFQSPNFPQAFIGNNSSSSCDIQLKAENPNNRLWIAMLNGAASGIKFFHNDEILQDYSIGPYSSSYDIAVSMAFPVDTLTVKVFDNSIFQTWTGYQAIAVPYDPSVANFSCPLSTQTFDFNANPDLIIPVVSEFEHVKINKSCNWMFNMGNSQQLKIVVYELEGFPISSFILYSNENAIYDFSKWTKDDSSLYFNGTSFTLVFITNDTYPPYSGNNFFILFSAVPISSTYISDGCHMSQSNGLIKNKYITTYTNVDYINGYPAYQKCENTITFPSNYEATIGVYELNYEACCDLLLLTYGNNQTIQLEADFDDDDGTYIPDLKHLNSKANGSILSFTSDGNIQEAGYKVILTTYECICGKQNYVAECDKIVTVTPLDNNENFCDNMDCIYQITSNCRDSYFRINPIIGEFRDKIDYLILENNGKVVENLTVDSEGEYKNILKDNNFTVIFHSGTSQNILESYKLWYIEIIPIYPNFVKLMLDDTVKSHVFWLADMGKNDVYTVCAATGQLEVFVTTSPYNTLLYHLELFDDKDLNNYVGNFNDALTSTSPELPKSRKSTSGSNHCKNDISVFQIPLDTWRLSFGSTEAGPCEATILSYLTWNDNIAALPYIWIYKMNTSSTEKIIFKSTINQKILFEVNATEIRIWQSIGIYTTAISIILPPSSEFIISFVEKPVSINHKDSFLYVQKGIMASPSYIGYTHKFDGVMLYAALWYAELVVKDFYGNPDIVYRSNGKNFTLIPSMNLSVSSEDINFYYKETDASKNGFLIEYTLYKNEPTTSTTTIKISTSLETTKTTILKSTFSTIGTFSSPSTTTTLGEKTTTSSSDISTTISQTSSFATTTKTTTKNDVTETTTTNIATVLECNLIILVFCVNLQFF